KKITKGFAAITDFVTRHCLSIGIEPAPHRRFRCFLGPASVNGIGFVTGTPLVDRLAMKGITLVVVEGTYRTVDRNFIKIRSAQTQQLCIGIREQPALQQRIVSEVDTGNNVADMEGGLLC